MTQPVSNTSQQENKKKFIHLDLSPYYTFGFSLIKLMIFFAMLGLILVGIYEFCSGGTAG